jgi:hypothetical protein
MAHAGFSSRECEFAGGCVQNLVLPMLMWNTVQHPPRWRRIGHILLSGMWCLVSQASCCTAADSTCSLHTLPADSQQEEQDLSRVCDLLCCKMVVTMQVSVAAVTSAVYRLATVGTLEFWADVQVGPP